MTSQIFISYSKKDSDFAFKLADDLIAAGHKIWIDRSLKVGEDWAQTIETNLEKSQEVIVVLSPNSVESKWVQHEGSIAYGLKKPMFPVLIEKIPDEKMPLWAEKFQYHNFVGVDYQTGFNALQALLTPPNPTQVLLDQEVNTYLQTGDLLRESLLQVILEARGTLVVSEHAEELIQKSIKSVELRRQRDKEQEQALAEEKEQARKQMVAAQRLRRLIRSLIGVFAITLLVAGIAGYFAFRTTYPKEMAGDFNIAVAEFTVIDDSGAAVASEDGSRLSNWIYAGLERDFGELRLPFPVEIWPPDYIGKLKGNTDSERAEYAAELAGRIHATILLYGVIVQGKDRSSVVPNFYVNDLYFADIKQIVGPHAMGEPLAVILPFTPGELTIATNRPLNARIEAMGLMTIGLAYSSVDDFETALNYFLQASHITGWSDSAGKEVMYALIGFTELNVGKKMNSLGPLVDAENYFHLALSINPLYTLAMVGEADVFYLQATGSYSDACQSKNVDISLLDQAENLLVQALAVSPGTDVDIELRTHFGLGRIYLCRAEAEDHAWLAKAKNEFKLVVSEYKRANTGVAEFVGYSYAGLGLIARREEDNASAIENYESAIELVTPYYKAYYSSQLGEIYADEGQVDLAVAAYQEAIRIAKENADENSASKYSQEMNELTNNSQSVP
jgi:tetratricopeptide (TPR) repeat protein